MASPPFNPNESSPGDSDIVSQYPANERTFRDIIEDWINTEHSPSGHHKIPINTTAGLAGISDWVVGSIGFDSDLNVLKIVRTLGPTTFSEIGLEKNTRAVFQQTAAPLGWTKETNALYNDAAICGTTGSVTTGGTTGFASRFSATGISFSIAQANLPNYTLPNTLGLSPSDSFIRTGSFASVLGGATFSGVPVGANNASISITGSITSGGSGTAITTTAEVKFFNTIVATKA